MLTDLNLAQEVNWDWFILLVAKTGTGFQPTKNQSSVRKIQIDWQTVIQFSELLRGLPEENPIFIRDEKKVYNSTVNGVLERHCMKSSIPVISIHGLRHTHASLLLFAGVSIASVARAAGSCQHDHHAKNIPSYYSRA